MNDQAKTNAKLLKEISVLTKKIKKLEKSRETAAKRVEEVLQESEERYRALFDRSLDLIYTFDFEGRFIDANAAALNRLGYTKEEIHSLNFTSLLSEDQLPIAFKSLQETRETGIQKSLLVLRLRHKDGSDVYVETQSSIVMSNGTPVAIRAIARDITERKRAEKMLKESEEKYRGLVESAQEGIFQVTAEGRYLTLNSALARMLGYDSPEEVMATITDLARQLYANPDDRKKVLKMLNEKGSVSDFETQFLKKDGSRIWVSINTYAVRDEGGRLLYYQGINQDITEKKKIEAERKQMDEALRDSEKRFRELSIVDELTQLYNSRHFYFQLKSELDRSNRYEHPLTLLLLDLDNFKEFNDAYGHVEGDQVLQRFGQVLKRCMRNTDFAYRYGGEEFTILLPMTTNANGAIMAERIRAELKKESFSPEAGKDVHMTVSIGIGQFKLQEDMKDFVRRVDQLMYQAKKNGKDRICSES